jgi:hypothetical protein
MPGDSTGDPMEVDPIDGGPVQKTHNNSSTTLNLSLREQLVSAASSNGSSGIDDPKKAVEMLRSDDVSNRVAAAHKLDTIAKALGHQRTREVRWWNNIFYHPHFPNLF